MMTKDPRAPVRTACGIGQGSGKRDEGDLGARERIAGFFVEDDAFDYCCVRAEGQGADREQEFWQVPHLSTYDAELYKTCSAERADLGLRQIYCALRGIVMVNSPVSSTIW